MSRYGITDRCLALAGVFQAAWLTHTVAHAGQPDPAALTATLDSLQVRDAASTAEVFGGTAGVRVGLRTLRAALGGRVDQDLQRVLRYALGLLHLERLAVRDDALMQRVARGCERAASQAEHLGPFAPATFATLAETWVQTVGTLSPRIIVEGAPGRLQDAAVAAQVRAILLGGFRAAVLWRQVGGSRWSLLFGRGGLRREAERLLA